MRHDGGSEGSSGVGAYRLRVRLQPGVRRRSEAARGAGRAGKAWRAWRAWWAGRPRAEASRWSGWAGWTRWAWWSGWAWESWGPWRAWWARWARRRAAAAVHLSSLRRGVRLRHPTGWADSQSNVVAAPLVKQVTDAGWAGLLCHTQRSL